MIQDTLFAKFIANCDRSNRLLYENVRIPDGSFLKLNPEASDESVCRTGFAIKSLMNLPKSEQGIYVRERHRLEEIDDEGSEDENV